MRLHREAFPDNRTEIVHEISIHRVVDGRIAETWAVTDNVGFYQQITGQRAPEASDNMG